MICNPCKSKNHDGCPTKAWVDPKKLPTGLGDENNRIQLTGLCPCQHRVPFVKSDVGTEFVAQIDAAVVPA